MNLYIHITDEEKEKEVDRVEKMFKIVYNWCSNWCSKNKVKGEST